MNAADFYLKAFASLPEGDFGSYHGRLGIDDPETDRLVERGGESLDLLHQAVRCPECDWGLEAILGVPVDHYGGARRLAILALLRAERLFRQGEFPGWIEEMIAVMTLGRHLGRGLYVSGMAGFPIEDLAVTKVIEVLDILDDETCRALAGRLDSLPSFPTLARAALAEQTFFRVHYPEKFAALVEDGDISSEIRKEFGLPAPTEENAGLAEWIYPAGDPAERMLVASGGSRSGLLTLANEALAAFDALAEIAESPADARPEKLAPLRDAGGRNPLLAEVLRWFETMCPIWDRYDKRTAHLRSLVESRTGNT